MSDSNARARGIVQRSWLIVTIAAVVGAAVAGGVTLARTGTSYTGTAVISVDAIALSSFARLPKVDEIIGAKGNPEIVNAIAKAAGVEPGAVSSSVKVFSTGNPQNRITVTYVSGTKDAASAGAKAGAAAIANYAKARGDKVLGMYKGILLADEQALADFNKTANGDPATVETYRWNLNRAIATDNDTYAWLNNAYRYDGSVATKQTSRRMGLIQAVLAGALAGLFIGVVIAAVREVSYRRAS